MSLDLLNVAGAAFLEFPRLGVIVTDADHRIAHWSKAAESLFKINSDHAVNRQLEQVIQFLNIEPSDRQETFASLVAVEPQQSGKPILVESTRIPLNDDQQNRVGFLFIIEDITERRRNERMRGEAEQTSRNKDMFIAMAAHELRTPINAILGWAQLFRIGKVNAAETAMAFATIEHNAKSLSKLIEDLLDISRIVAGKLRLEVRRIELLMIINEAIYSLRPAATAKHIEIKTALDGFGVAVAGDPFRLQQIVFNLLSNAIKFTPDEGCVEAGLERVGSKARFTVSDTGPGISEDFLPYIFDPFSQASAATSERRGGLGLGLAIVRHIVELHKGTIRVDSSKGRGTSFIVELPLWRDLLALKDGPPVRSFTNKPGLSLAGLRVLVVDDCRDLLEVLDVALTLYGAAVELATTASEAIDVIRRWKPDVMISDIGLQGEDGYALISKLRDMEAEQGRATPSIALTGHRLEEDQGRAIAAGYQMFISKPVELSQLEAAIAVVTGRAGR